MFDVGRVTYETVGGNHVVIDMCNSICDTYLKHLMERIRSEGENNCSGRITTYFPIN